MVNDATTIKSSTNEKITADNRRADARVFDSWIVLVVQRDLVPTLTSPSCQNNINHVALPQPAAPASQDRATIAFDARKAGSVVQFESANMRLC